MIKRGQIWLILTALTLMAFGAHAAEIDQKAGLRVYTAMNFVPEEREFYGLQIIVIPYSEGTKILWRSGEGRLVAPLLLDVTRVGQSWRVVVPETGDHGVWELSIQNGVMHAAGPRDLHFDLQELTFK
jgi:hypothetical protein